MKSIDQKMLKKIQLNILQEVADFCDENNIKYYLFCGTLIGAVRHNGYIPWDDDIDICMPRKDYEKFYNLFNKNNSSDLKFIDYRNYKGYYLASGKVINTKTVMKEKTNFNCEIGVYIDVFAMDNMPTDKRKAIYFDRLINPFRKILLLKTIAPDEGRQSYKNFVLKIGNIVFKPIPTKLLIWTITNLAKKHNDDDFCQNIGDISVFTYGLKEMFPVDYFGDGVKLIFEGRSFTVPEKYDLLLKKMYGDYMKLPPIEKQISHHSFEAYWKD